MKTLVLSAPSANARRTVALAAVVALSLPLLPAPAFAQSSIATPSPYVPSGVLTLEASANAEVPADVVRIELFYEQQGNDPAALSQALNQRTESALKKAREQDVVKVKTGAFSISPSTDRDGRISTWRGRSELLLESTDFGAASKLAGQLSNSLQVGGVSFSLSPEAQQQAETRLAKEAIKSFQQQALAAAQSFGYSGFTVREVNVGRSGVVQPRAAFRAMAAAPMMAKVDSVPIEAGTTTVTVSVNGAVQMTR